MQCYGCRHDFCWMCLGEWRTHGSEYYECSKYRENPNVAHDSHHAQVSYNLNFSFLAYRTNIETFTGTGSFEEIFALL